MAVTVQMQFESAVTELYQDAFVGSSIENGVTVIQFDLRQLDFQRALETHSTISWRKEPYHIDVHELSTFHNPIKYRFICAQGSYLDGQNQRIYFTPEIKHRKSQYLSSSLARSIFHLKCQAFLGPALSLVWPLAPGSPKRPFFRTLQPNPADVTHLKGSVLARSPFSKAFFVTEHGTILFHSSANVKRMAERCVEKDLTCVRYYRTMRHMNIRSVSHRGLQRFIEDDDARGIRQDLVDRIRKILAVLIVASDMTGVKGPPGWRIHQLSGDRAGTWSLSVSGNWRMTFDVVEDEIWHLHLEDYH